MIRNLYLVFKAPRLRTSRFQMIIANSLLFFLLKIGKQFFAWHKTNEWRLHRQKLRGEGGRPRNNITSSFFGGVGGIRDVATGRIIIYYYVSNPL